MTANLAKSAALAAGLMAALLLGGCDKSAEQQAQQIAPVPIHAGDECHVCGMIISDFPGPKGEAIEKHGAVRKFCSSTEMFGWWLQPENRLATARMFVHDMVYGDWAKPDDQHMIDASKAYYVVARKRPGGMGIPLASFANQADAEQFAQQQGGGKVLRLQDINEELLQQGAGMGHGMASDAPAADAHTQH